MGRLSVEELKKRAAKNEEKGRRQRNQAVYHSCVRMLKAHPEALNTIYKYMCDLGLNKDELVILVLEVVKQEVTKEERSPPTTMATSPPSQGHRGRLADPRGSAQAIFGRGSGNPANLEHNDGGLGADRCARPYQFVGVQGCGHVKPRNGRGCGEG